jgi:predicted DNA binding protein
MNKNYFSSYNEVPNNVNLIIEHTLRYGDIDEIFEVISKYGKEKCKSVWQKTLIADKRIIKLNHFIGKFIFDLTDSELEQILHNSLTDRIDRINNVFNR